MAKRRIINRLNELDPKDWLKFQKSWFVHNPPQRRKDVLRHPAKFPETLAQEFIEFFTRRGGVVLDPMVGTGSAIVAALRSGRHSYGVELNPAYAAIAQQVIAEERARLSEQASDLHAASAPRPDGLGRLSELAAKVIVGNAADFARLADAHSIPLADYVLTSPPYWDMLRARGAQTQKKRRASHELDVFYSEDPADLGNLSDYNEFLSRLVDIYAALKPFVKQGAYLTIIVKNVKKGGVIYPLAWDLGRMLSQLYTLKDERIWCQDNQRLAPYGLGSAWVSNTFHHYCLQFRND